jgi:hypothetical protein
MFMKNRIMDKVCFAIGTGPSIETAPWKFLGTQQTIGVNGIGVVFDKTDWRPTYYCANPIDPRVVAEVDKIFLPDIPKLREKMKGLTTDADIVWMPYQPKKDWSDDITKVVYGAATIMHVALQVVGGMGFRKIVLLGCDGYVSNGPNHAYEDTSSPIARSYRERAESVSQRMREAMSFANDRLVERGIKLIDATRMSHSALEDIL